MLNLESSGSQLNETFRDRIILEKFDFLEKLEEFAFKGITEQIKFLHDRDKSVRLVILDSITALFRPEFEKDHFSERKTVMCNICTQLKFIAQKYHIAVLIVNQVSENIDENAQMSYSNKFRPQKVIFEKYFLWQ